MFDALWCTLHYYLISILCNNEACPTKWDVLVTCHQISPKQPNPTKWEATHQRFGYNILPIFTIVFSYLMSGKGFLDFHSFWMFVFHFLFGTFCIFWRRGHVRLREPCRHTIQNRHIKMKPKRSKRMEIQESFSRHKLYQTRQSIISYLLI